MTRVVILGAGVMGTAFGLPLSDRGMEVRLVGTHLDRDLVAAMKETRVHPRLKAEIGANITVYQDSEMAEAFAALTPGRQRSYVIVLSQAKTDATQVKRIAKLRDKILAGKGANEY